jgi:hypothetical protein
MKNFLVIFSSILLLSACSTSRPHPKMLSFTPASVVIDFSENDLHEATSLAQQFCSSIQKDAQYVRTEESGWLSTEKHAFFNCIAHGRDNNSSSSAGNNSHMPIINNFK